MGKGEEEERWSEKGNLETGRGGTEKGEKAWEREGKRVPSDEIDRLKGKEVERCNSKEADVCNRKIKKGRADVTEGSRHNSCRQCNGRMQIKLPEIKGAAVMKGNRSNKRKKILLEEIKKSKEERRFCFGKGSRLLEKSTA
jgi:hypothetical protein